MAFDRAFWRSNWPLGPARGCLWRSKSLLRPARGRLWRSKSLLRPARSRLWRSKSLRRLARSRLWRSKSPLRSARRRLWRSKSPLRHAQCRLSARNRCAGLLGAARGSKSLSRLWRSKHCSGLLEAATVAVACSQPHSLFEVAVRGCWARCPCSQFHSTLLHLAPCMDMHGFTLVYIYIYGPGLAGPPGRV